MDPLNAVPPNVAYLNNVVAKFLTGHGFPVRDYSVGGIGTRDSRAAGEAMPGQVFFSDAMRPELARLGAYARKGRRGNQVFLGPGEYDAMNVALHEGLHQMRFGRTPGVYGSIAEIGTPGGYEEAAAEAVTQDLLPIFALKQYGTRMPGATSPDRRSAYHGKVKQFRQLSTFGSGAGKFTDRPARVWRRSFLHADANKRQEMIDAATAARIAWGQRTGR